MMIQELLTSLSLGLLASTSPCVFPLYPGFLAYIGAGQANLGAKARYFLGFFVLAGVLSAMLLLGGLIALLAIPIGSALRWIIPVADLIILALGVMLIFNINPFKMLPQIRVPALRHPFANAFVYGLLYGPIALPCSGPLVVGIFALSLSAADAANRLLVFLWFGIGFGLPLLILSFLAGGFQRQVTRFLARHARIVNLIGGLILVAVAVYDFVLNWDLIITIFGG